MDDLKEQYYREYKEIQNKIDENKYIKKFYQQ